MRCRLPALVVVALVLTLALGQRSGAVARPLTTAPGPSTSSPVTTRSARDRSDRLYRLAAARRLRILASAASDSKLDCVYTAESESVLSRFDALVHRRVNCAQVYNEESATWAEWEHPWFLNYQRDAAWTQWATRPNTDRHLVFDQTLIPTSLAHTAWRRACARGAYTRYARGLGRNLVAAGLSDSIMRLAPEMNGTWNIDNVGTTRGEMRLWTACWRKTVLAMRDVAGATMRIDWSINAAVRPIPLAQIYPGDETVDIIGIDAYDQGVSPGVDRWQTIDDRPDGIRDVLAFARAHRKPLSIPEWGLAGTADGDGGGDDPAYVRGIAAIVKDNDVAYQSYFFNYDFAGQLTHDRPSLRAYIDGFGDGPPASPPLGATGAFQRS